MGKAILTHKTWNSLPMRIHLSYEGQNDGRHGSNGHWNSKEGGIWQPSKSIWNVTSTSMAEQGKTLYLMRLPWKKSGRTEFHNAMPAVGRLINQLGLFCLTSILFSRGWVGTGTIMTAHNSIFMGPIKVPAGIKYLWVAVQFPGVRQRGAEDRHPSVLCHWRQGDNSPCRSKEGSWFQGQSMTNTAGGLFYAFWAW